MDLAARVVIVHHNRPAAALATAAAYAAQDVRCRVVIVDSGSTPEALTEVRAGGFEVLAIGENVGFGPGANAGLRAWLADPVGEAFAIVGPHDGRPLAGCVRRVLTSLAERPRAAMASAEYGPGEDLKPVVDKFFGGSFVPAERGEGWEAVDYPHGTLLALRREAVEEIGLFDER